MIYFNLIAVKQKITLSRFGSAENQERQTSKVICEKLNALFMYILLPRGSSTADESSANYQAHFELRRKIRGTTLKPSSDLY